MRTVRLGGPSVRTMLRRTLGPLGSGAGGPRPPPVVDRMTPSGVAVVTDEVRLLRCLPATRSGRSIDMRTMPVQQLTGMDAAFLHMETPATQGHVGSLTIFDAETAPGAFGFEEVKQILEQRLHVAPVLRRRLVEVPFGLDQPYTHENATFPADLHDAGRRHPRGDGGWTGALN